MKTKFCALLFITFIISTLGCEEDKLLFDGKSCANNCIILEGMVTDSIYGAPIENAEILVSQGSGFGLYSYWSTIGTVYSNEDGRFSFNFPVNERTSITGFFVLRVQKNSFTPIKESRSVIFQVDSSDIDIPIFFDLKMFPLTDIEFTIRNESKHAITNFKYTCENCLDCTTLIDSIITDSIFNYQTEIIAGLPTEIRYKYKKDGEWCRIGDNIIAEPMQTFYYDIKIED